MGGQGGGGRRAHALKEKRGEDVEVEERGGVLHSEGKRGMGFRQGMTPEEERKGRFQQKKYVGNEYVVWMAGLH